jgi:GDPmannose 4,6-dehydratase
MVVCVDSNYFRPTEVDLLIGDSSKAKRNLGWSPKYDLEQLATEMVYSDLEKLRRTMVSKPLHVSLFE